MRSFLIKYLVISLLAFCCHSLVQADELGAPVSLVSLIVNPDKYDGHKVNTAGILAWQRGEQSIYSTREQAENINITNSILLLLTEDDANRLLKKYHVTIDECNRSWIEIRGVFSPGKDNFPGALMDIVEIYPQGLILGRQNSTKKTPQKKPELNMNPLTH